MSLYSHYVICLYLNFHCVLAQDTEFIACFLLVIGGYKFRLVSPAGGDLNNICVPRNIKLSSFDLIWILTGQRGRTNN